MRIALVTDCPRTDPGPLLDGESTTVRAVERWLVETGHEARVLTPDPSVRRGRDLRTVLESYAPDLVHVTSPGAFGRTALKESRRLGLPSLVVEQSPLLDVTADRWRRRVAERTDAVLVTSTWMAGRLAEFGVGAALWTPGVDTEMFHPGLRRSALHETWSRSASGPRVVVGHVGALHKRHGVRRLAALSSIPGLRPVVIGSGPQRAWLRTRLPEAFFLDPATVGDTAVALASLDVLVSPGVAQTDCHVLRAAAACGVPVTAPRSGGVCTVVRNLETGVLHDPARPDRLLQAVAAVAGDRQRALLGGRARELALLRTWRDAVDELVADHYLPLLHGRSAVAA